MTAEGTLVPICLRSGNPIRKGARPEDPAALADVEIAFRNKYGNQVWLTLSLALVRVGSAADPCTEPARGRRWSDDRGPGVWHP